MASAVKFNLLICWYTWIEFEFEFEFQDTISIKKNENIAQSNWHGGHFNPHTNSEFRQFMYEQWNFK